MVDVADLLVCGGGFTGSFEGEGPLFDKALRLLEAIRVLAEIDSLYAVSLVPEVVRSQPELSAEGR